MAVAVMNDGDDDKTKSKREMVRKHIFSQHNNAMRSRDGSHRPAKPMDGTDEHTMIDCGTERETASSVPDAAAAQDWCCFFFDDEQ
jgi:hypothetical protein